MHFPSLSIFPEAKQLSSILRRLQKLLFIYLSKSLLVSLLLQLYTSCCIPATKDIQYYFFFGIKFSIEGIIFFFSCIFHNVNYGIVSTVPIDRCQHDTLPEHCSQPLQADWGTNSPERASSGFRPSPSCKSQYLLSVNKIKLQNKGQRS